MRIIRNILIILVIVISILIILFNISTKITPPVITDDSVLLLERENPDTNFYKIGNNWLKKNDFGLWEMYLEGSPFEIGVINGKLTRELIQIQEDAFVEQINNLIPSKSYLRFLKYFISWFNRDIEENIPEEYLQEIYGISFSSSPDYDYIGNNYERLLNYHAAHDIGHALQSLALVGCTSFATGLSGDDSSMIIGRNFDFYINETFAENKIVAFVNPDNGYRFMYITWASMIGVVSGMNEQGLTVTINAAKSDIPSKATTPVSLLAREILQYADNIEEAIEIAKKRKTFVSESLLIGSASDKNAVIIEKSPMKFGVKTTPENSIICSNHFQSEVFGNDENNLNHIAESASDYRQKRCRQLIKSYEDIDYLKAAEILRDYKGIDNVNIGIGNEKTMAQMISHHSVIFQPHQLRSWVSTFPYQLGEYLMYDIRYVFSRPEYCTNKTILYDSVLTIPASPFLFSIEYQNLIEFRKMRDILKKSITQKHKIENEESFSDTFISTNPDYYHGYVLLGNYYFVHNKPNKALSYYNIALTKEFENTTTRDLVMERIESIKNNGL